LDLDPPEVQQSIPIPQNNEGMLLLRPSFAIGKCIWKKFGLQIEV
jgi:hypothetical protein